MPTPLERIFGAISAISLRGVVLFGTLFFSYIILGGGGYLLGIFTPPYSFLKLQSDLSFNFLTTFLSLFLITRGLALAVLTGILKIQMENSDIIIILNMISVGIGAAAFSATYSTTVKFVFNILGIAVHFV